VGLCRVGFGYVWCLLERCFVSVVWFGLVWFGLVWFGLFVCLLVVGGWVVVGWLSGFTYMVGAEMRLVGLFDTGLGLGVGPALWWGR